MGPSTRTSRCIVEKICHPPQREVLFAYFNVSLPPTPPSTRTSRCIVEKFVTPLKEKFSLPISIFHSLLPQPQRELFVVSLKNLSPPSKRSSLCLFQFFTLSYPTLNENFSLYRCKICHPPQREVLFAYFNFSLSPTPPSTRGSLCLVDNELNEHSPPPRPCNPLGFFVSFFQFYQLRLVQLHPNGFQAGANIGFSLRAPQGLATPLGLESFFPFYQTCLLQAGPQPCI